MSGVSPETIAKILRAAQKPGTRSTASLSLFERAGGLRRFEKIAEAGEKERAAQAVQGLAAEARAFDVADSGVRLGAKVDEPAMQVLRAISANRAVLGTRVGRSLSQADRFEVLCEMFRRIRGQTQRSVEELAALRNAKVIGGYVVSAAGLLREVHGRAVRPIANAILKLRHGTLKLRKTVKDLEILDSAIIGPTRLPTRVVKGQRGVALGPDRVVGLAKRAPQMVRETLEDGTEAVFRIEGVLDLKIVAEIKGRTTASDGIRQFVALQRRGTRGYIQIGDEVWLLAEYRPDRVEHFLVAPAGDALRQATQEAKELGSLGIRITPAEIAAEAERDIQTVARSIVDDIARHALAPKGK